MWRWFARHPLVTCVLLVVLVAAPAYVIMEIRVSCVEDWARDTTRRSEQLGQANREWRDGLAEVLRTARSGDRAAAQEKFDRWIVLSDQLNRTGQDNPVPPPPDLRC